MTTKKIREMIHLRHVVEESRERLHCLSSKMLKFLNKNYKRMIQVSKNMDGPKINE